MKLPANRNNLILQRVIVKNSCLFIDKKPEFSRLAESGVVFACDHARIFGLCFSPEVHGNLMFFACGQTVGIRGAVCRSTVADTRFPWSRGVS